VIEGLKEQGHTSEYVKTFLEKSPIIDFESYKGINKSKTAILIENIQHIL